MILIDSQKCVACELCASDCPRELLSVQGGKLSYYDDNCLLCGHCVCVCPQNALQIQEYDMSETDEITSPAPPVSPDALLSTIKRRRSVRRFRPDPVPGEILNQIIQAGRYTPTARNAQDVRYIVIRDRLDEFTRVVMRALAELPVRRPANIQQDLLERYAQRWVDMEKLYLTNGTDRLFYRAPALLILTGTNDIDPALAASNAELMVNALGLGCVYVGFLEIAGRTETVRDYLALEPGRKIVCSLAVGYPDVRYFRTAPRAKANIRYL